MLLKTILFFPFFLLEIIFFKIVKKNSWFSYRTMINLFCITGGWSNDFLHTILKKKEKKSKNNLKFREKKFFSKNGYLVKENYLNENLINNLRSELKTIKGYWAGDNFKSKGLEFFKNKVKTTKFYYTQKELLKLKSIQKIILQKNLINLARETLNAEPIISNVVCWHSFPSKKPDEQAAQMWHFDMERPKWIKFFIYLSDCNSLNGPHSFIIGSHKNDGIPKDLRMHGYKRLDDEIINRNFPKKNLIDIKCEKGSLLIEDTRGLHKGKILQKGKRSMLSIEFTSSMFGGPYEKINMRHDSFFIKNLSKINNSDFIFQNFIN